MSKIRRFVIKILSIHASQNVTFSHGDIFDIFGILHMSLLCVNSIRNGLGRLDKDDYFLVNKAIESMHWLQGNIHD